MATKAEREQAEKVARQVSEARKEWRKASGELDEARKAMRTIEIKISGELVPAAETARHRLSQLEALFDLTTEDWTEAARREISPNDD